MVGSPDGDSACIRLEPFGLWLTRSGLLGTPGDWGFNRRHITLSREKLPVCRLWLVSWFSGLS